MHSACTLVSPNPTNLAKSNDTDIIRLFNRSIAITQAKAISAKLTFLKKNFISLINISLIKLLAQHETIDELKIISKALSNSLTEELKSFKTFLTDISNLEVNAIKKSKEFLPNKNVTPDDASNAFMKQNLVEISNNDTIVHWMSNHVLYVLKNFDTSGIKKYSSNFIPSHTQSIYLRNKIYFMGGKTVAGECLQSFVELDPIHNTLKHLTNMLYKKMHHSVCCNNTHIYAISGCLDDVTRLRECERYSFVTGKWEEIPHSLHSRCRSASFIHYDNYHAGFTLYNMGGCLENGMATNEVELLSLNFKSNWLALKTSGNPAIMKCMAVYLPSDEIIVVGGYRNEYTSSKCSVLSFQGDKRCVLEDDSEISNYTYFECSPAPVISGGYAYLVDAEQNVLRYSIKERKWKTWNKPNLESILMTPIAIL